MTILPIRLSVRESRERLWADFTSLPGLASAFAVITLLAMGPLQGLDSAAHHGWAQRYVPGSLSVLHVLDRIAGQSVDLPVMMAVASALAIRGRTWRPLMIAAGAEAAFYGIIGVLKVAFARPAPLLKDPGFFDAGFGAHAWQGISFPSGHASEAVLIYGTVVYLLCTRLQLSRRLRRVLVAAVAVIAANAVFVSFVLGYHWITDLAGGLVAGAAALRLLMLADRAPAQRFAAPVKDWRACTEHGVTTPIGRLH